MIIAITSQGPSLDSKVDPKFGRCEYFIIYDLETMKYESINNPNARVGGGAGVQSAELMADKNVSVVLTGNPGPKASQTFDAADIKVAPVSTGSTVQSAIDEYKAGL